MTKFFVGQRVKIVSADNPSGRSLIGQSAVITEIEDDWCGPVYGLDISPIEYDPGNDCYWVWHGDQLEPILPSGHAPAEMDVHELLPFLKEGVAA